MDTLKRAGDKMPPCWTQFVSRNFIEQELPYLINISCLEYQYTNRLMIKTGIFSKLLNNCQYSIINKSKIVDSVIEGTHISVLCKRRSTNTSLSSKPPKY